MSTVSDEDVNTTGTDRTGANDGGAKPSSGRRRREPLTRETVLRAGLRLMDAEGLEAVTMRHLGREVGVEAMSLYNHVRDKEDLLDGITELVLSQMASPPETDDWVEQAHAACHEWRRVFNAHPNVVRLLAERNHPLTSVAALRPVEFALEILTRAGLSSTETVRAFQAIGGYLFGFVLMETGNLVAGQSPKALVDDPETLLRLDPGDELPRFSELAPYFVQCDMDETFEFGLELLLDGIRARTDRAGRPSASVSSGE